MKNKELNFYRIGKNCVFPLTPDAQHIFDEVVLDRTKEHIQQLTKWFNESRPNVIINIVGDDTNSIMLNNWR